MGGSETRKVLDRRARALVTLALMLPLSACVSVAKYRHLEAERNGLAADKRGLEQQLAALGGEKTTLEARLEEQQGELSKMQGTYDALVKQLEQELASGMVQIEQLRDGIRVNLAQEILFPTGSAELDEEGEEVLLRVSEELAKVSHRIEVEGHTDDVGISKRLARTYPTNWELAGARAARVVRLFEDSGIGGDRLAAVSFGQQHPIAANDGPENRARNRRIEVRLLPNEANPVPARLAPGTDS